AAVHGIDTEDSYPGIERRGWNRPRIAPWHSDGAVRIDPAPVIADAGLAVTSADADLRELPCGLINGLFDLRDGRCFPGGGLVLISVHHDRSGVSVGGLHQEVGNLVRLASRLAEAPEGFRSERPSKVKIDPGEPFVGSFQHQNTGVQRVKRSLGRRLP